MDSLLQDFRFGLRQLRRSPGFMLTAVLMLALGVGANTAIFSLLDQALLRSLPVRDPGRLFVLEGTGTVWEGHSGLHGGDPAAYFSYPMYKDLRDRNQVFEGLLATSPADVGITRNGNSQAGRAELVSGNYFSVLGVQPALGRLLTQADDTQPGAHPVAVLSFAFWKTHAGLDPKAVGSAVSINGHPFQVVGVAPQNFRSAVWGETPDLFVPMAMLGQIVPGQDRRLSNHKDRWMNILGRLKPGVSRDTAEAGMDPLWHALRAEELKALGSRSSRFVDDFLTQSHLRLVPAANGFSYQRDDFRKPLLAIMAMAMLVLLITVVNVASLLLVRSAARVREFTLRYARGASGSRILVQLLIDSLLIGLTGGVAGVLLAPLATRALIHQLAGDTSHVAFSPEFDGRLLLFHLAVALGVSVVFGLVPLLQLRRSELTLSLRQVSGTGGGAMLSFRRLVVCLQISLSVLLLVGAGLFVRTMQKLRAVDVGFNTSHLLTFGISPKLAGYAPAAVPALQKRVFEALQVLPGVQAVAETDDAELADDESGGNVTVAGYNPPPDSDFDVEEPRVDPGYLSTMQMPLLAGRSFTEDDDGQHPLVAIVNQNFAKHFCGSIAACLGRQMATGEGNHVALKTEIVGVVHDAKHQGLREPVQPTVFRPLLQDDSPSHLYFYIRSFNDPAQALPTVRRAVQQLDPNLVPVALRTMDAQIDDSLSNDRMVASLASAFGALAALLAGVGIYGVLAYATAQRTREIGVRMALGASRVGVSWLVLNEALRLAVIGVCVGLPAAVALAHLLSSQLFNVSPADPFSLLTAMGLIALITATAALVPARRAASVNPTVALRTE